MYIHVFIGKDITSPGRLTIEITRPIWSSFAMIDAIL